MSLAGQTAWIVGGVGVIGRGIARGLLKAGATVIVNSRSEERLKRIATELEKPSQLVLVHGSLLPGYATATADEVLSDHTTLNHVVAHGAVRYWTEKKTGCDESFSLDLKEGFLEQKPQDFADTSSRLATLHFSAAKELIPRIENNPSATYTFVTGDGGGHVSGRRSAMGEVNSHHVWGLSAALRHELSHSGDDSVNCREVRVKMQVNRPFEEREAAPRARPLSEDIGDLCAGVVAAGTKVEENGRLIPVDTQDHLEKLLWEYKIDSDERIRPLPNVWEKTGSL